MKTLIDIDGKAFSQAQAALGTAINTALRAGRTERGSVIIVTAARSRSGGVHVSP